MRVLVDMKVPEFEEYIPLFLHLPRHNDQYHSIKGFPNSYNGKNCTQQAIKSLILNTHT